MGGGGGGGLGGGRSQLDSVALGSVAKLGLNPPHSFFPVRDTPMQTIHICADDVRVYAVP